MTENEKFLTEELAKTEAIAFLARGILLELCVLLIKKGLISKAEFDTFVDSVRLEGKISNGTKN